MEGMIDDALHPAATEDGADPELEPTTEPVPDRRLRLVAAGTAVAVGLGVAGWGLVAAVAGATSRSGFPDVHGLHAGPAISGSAVAARVDPFVVDISAYDGETGGGDAGTGMVLTSDGEILTNNHVVAGSTAIQVKLVSTGRTYAATVIGTDATEDVALLKLRGASGLTTLNAADPSSVGKGMAVAAIGNALAKPGKPTVAVGRITDTNQTITAGDEGGPSERLTGMLQTDANVVSGDSGGPLVDSTGQVIGMDTAASARGSGDSGIGESAGFVAATGFAIPITKALSVAKQIASGHPSATVVIGTRGRLGVIVAKSDISSFSDQAGATVEQVIPGTAAADAGLQPGDVITAVATHSVGSGAELTTVMHTTRSGDRITITWTDASGTSHHATETLGSGPAL
jgi:S1-C subfamily serine protease